MRMNQDRGKVWLAVCGLVLDQNGRWLVVKKKYGGAKGKWTLPAGFVEPAETLDEAVEREILEETGIICTVIGLLGARTGVLQSSISDNMMIFACKPKNTTVLVQEKELEEACWMTPDSLLADKHTSVMIRELIKGGYGPLQKERNAINPGNQFGYTAYKLFL
ncbi:NUDIX domain-containing protein [Bacillus norwichensis]|uniref:NUDIX hydrolase n=1 Tax=Bacillus norwichensis TaxID=2762217 RepID=A0ABR8VR89_9BACI|nr:NUDIX hydrolase [Bacillus norwichensis]MBD8006936.1 NUDIX hydrolase [Bacillus norwichensis]